MSSITQREAPPYTRIQYVSLSTLGVITEKMKTKILTVATKENSKHNITGVLICVRDMFFQIIEGKTADIEQLFANIVNDSRHNNVACVDKSYFESEDDRMFPSWDMKSIEVDCLFPTKKDVLICGENCNPLDPTHKRVIETAFSAFTTMMGSMFRAQQVFKNYAQPSVTKFVRDGLNPLCIQSVVTEKIVVFIDLVNYTTLTEIISQSRSVAEIVRILNLFFACVMEIVEEHGGDITKLIGDCVMCHFDGKDSQKAIDCSLKILERLDHLRNETTDPFEKLIYCTIGISKGEVILGNVGTVGRKLDYTVIGDSVNTSARLQSFASTTQYYLIFDENVKNDLINEDYVISCGSIELKGKRNTVNAYTIENVYNRKPQKEDLNGLFNVCTLSIL